MFRPIDPTRLREELRRLQRLDEARGIPLLEGYFGRIREEGRVARNPQIYHLLEINGELRGYTCLVPIYPESYRAFLVGERFPWTDLTGADMLTQAEYARARVEGAWVWLESFSANGDTARRELGEYVYHSLTSLHLKGLVVTTSTPQGEADCRWLGLVERYTYGPCPTGLRKLWYADEAATAPRPGEPFGKPVPARLLFLAVHQRFGGPRSLGLSATERRVARLFYLEDHKTDEVARLLNLRPGTVKTHLQRIRDKAEPIVGSRLSRRIAAYVEEHPAELASNET